MAVRQNLIDGSPQALSTPYSQNGSMKQWVSRQPLHTEVTAKLRKLIVNGKIEPGERLNENDLADFLDVSRTPLREALRTLQSEGLIVHEPNRGSCVSHITLAHTVELFDALAGLEGYCGRIAVRSVTDEQIVELADLHHKMLDAHHKKDRYSYLDLKYEIHRAYVASGGNSILVDLHAKLLVGAQRIRLAVITSMESWDHLAAAHMAILSAIEARKAEIAGSLIEELVRGEGEIVCERLQGSEAVQPRRRRSRAYDRLAGF